MKIFFLLALLANIVFFLREYNSSSLNTDKVTTKMKSNQPKQIFLLTEPPKNTKQIERVSTPVVPKTNNNTGHEKEFCYQIGPFDDKNKVERWRILNRIDKSALNQLTKQIKINHYLAYSPPPTKTGLDNQQKTQLFKENDIKDFAVYKEGKFKGGISLGAFSRVINALNIKEKMAGLGVDVEIEQISKNKNILYIQLTSSDKEIKNSLLLSSLQKITNCIN